MKLLCITDLHGSSSTLQDIIADAGPIDGILLGGDITDFDTPNAAEELVGLAQTQCDTVFAVAGNCDSAAIDQRLVELDVSVFGRGRTRDGLGFYGCSAMPPWTGNMYELTEEEIASALQQGFAQVRSTSRQVMLVHPPPRDTTLDRVRSGRHVGSLSVRRAIQDQCPALVVCGHIHESRGIEQMGLTTMVNCGPAFRGNYALADIDAQPDSPVDVQLRSVRIRRE